MHIPFRVLISSQEMQVRLMAENLLKTVKAKCLPGETQDAILAQLTSPEGIDLVVIDGAWSGLSIETIYRTCRSRTAVPVETYLVVLVEETNAAGAVLAFNAGADAVIRRNLDPIEFLNACRAGQRLSVLAKMHRVAMEEKATAQAVLAEAEKEAKEAEDASAVLLSGGAAETAPDAGGAGAALTAGTNEGIASPAAAVLQGRRGGASSGREGEAKPVLEEEHAHIVVKQLEAVSRQVLVDQGASQEACRHDAADAAAIDGGVPEWAEFVGWQGLFWPIDNLWFDILFYFSRAGAENLCRWTLQRQGRDDNALLMAVNQYLVSVQATYRAHYETGYGPGSTILCQPLAMPRPFWIAEVGKADHTRVLKFPGAFTAYNFHIAPAALQVKMASAAAPGDVLNETIAARGQRPGPGVLPLANRGVILTESRLNKIVPDLEANRTLWVIEPSLFARRIGALAGGD